MLTRSRLPVTGKYLYNAASLFHFVFCLNCKVDVAFLSAEFGVVNVVSSTLLLSGVL